MEAMAEKFGDKASFVFLYTREPHAGEGQFADIKQPETFEERVAMAKRLQEEHKVKRLIVIDEMDGRVQKAYGTLPNMAYIIGTDGIVAHKTPWTHANELEKALTKLLEVGGKLPADKKPLVPLSNRGPSMPMPTLKFRYEVDNVREESVIAPSGAELAVHVHTPYAPGKFPALVLVPPGTMPGTIFDNAPPMLNPSVLARMGYVAVHFDPEGRGDSEGEEDFNGFRHQDDLAAVIEFTAELPEVDKERIGVLSVFHGIAMAAGCLGRRPELPVKVLFDFEGPSCVMFMRTTNPQAMFRFDPPEDTEEFWAQREAVRFISKLKCRYFRFQGHRDFLQGSEKGHAIELLNAATQAGVWNRCNDNEPNITYDAAQPEKYRWERDMSKVIDYLDELFKMLDAG